MEKINLKVEGMTCSNCALTIAKYLEKEGLQQVKVNPIDGSVSFEKAAETSLTTLKQGIDRLGYHVLDTENPSAARTAFLSNSKQRFLFTLPFTGLLMLHMVHPWVPIHWIMNPWVQLGLCVPVFSVGMWFFGRSAFKSLISGIPNMNVLVTVGALAAFGYSLVGVILQDANYLFFETAASTLTLVFLGNYLEEASIGSTQRALKSLIKSQKVMANMIAFDDQHQEQILPIENTQLRVGDLVLIKSGEQVPIDCKILWGDCRVNEAILSGESIPLEKTKKDFLIGGSIVEDGLVKAQVTAVGTATVLSSIVQMVQTAQAEKPPMQKMADKISAVFVPAVIGISVIGFLVNYFGVQVGFSDSLMRSIAILVISCPCAMGLATPAAIAVGLGRAARKGILFRNAASLESFKKIKQVVFDKTGTLTTGRFSIENFHSTIDPSVFKDLVFSLEKYSNHPIATSIALHWKSNNLIQWKKIDEIKGIGIVAEDAEGNVYESGSHQILPATATDRQHNVYILKNKTLIGWIDIKDEIRPEAKKVIEWLQQKGIRTILLTGDMEHKAQVVAKELGMDEVYAQQSPQEKMNKIAALNKTVPTAMVGDGINDAPALANATLGISLSDSSQLALQHADVVLMHHGLQNLPEALGIGMHTYITIKQNLFWAFVYNIVAIPVAGIGWLTPTFSALAMGCSDVVLAANSVRLFVKKVL